MIRRKLKEIAYMIEGRLAEGADGDTAIIGVSTDTRSIENGNLFVPLIGENFNGHDYAAEALAQGAAAVLWQANEPNAPEGAALIIVNDTLAALQRLASEYRKQLQVRVIGVTGSNGKTTTKDMIGSVLATTYKVHKTAGNLNNHIGLPLTILQMDESVEMAVLEMGMSGRGEIDLLSRIGRPEAVVITNVGEAHLQQLGTREEIARAKLEIISGLKDEGLLVYNGDEPLLENELARTGVSQSMLRFRFGLQPENDFYPVGVMLDSEKHGTFFMLNTSNSATYFVPLLGTHNVVNALAAIAIGKYMGVSDSDIRAGLRKMKATGMRIEVVKAPSGLTILNDAYNASPTSMKAAVDLFVELPGYSRKVLVLGDMLELGEEAENFHRQIGGLLPSDRFDYIFTFGELASNIAKEAAKQFGTERAQAFMDKEKLFQKISSMIRKDDVVLVKGSRGMKLEEIVHRLMELDL